MEDSEKMWLREVSINDDYEGLRFLQELVNEEGIMVAPAPKDIDENNLYDYYWSYLSDGYIRFLWFAALSDHKS